MRIPLAGLVALVLSGTPTFADVAVLKIDAGKIVAPVSPLHAGLMTEEINHSYDGGLYGELLPNRSLNEAFVPRDGGIMNWSFFTGGTGKGSLALGVTDPVSETLPACLEISSTTASPGNRAGVANPGYWGIPVIPGASYRVSFFGRTKAGEDKTIVVGIENAEGTSIYAHAGVKIQSSTWKRYDAVITIPAGTKATTHARFVLALESPGTFSATGISLFPPTYRDRLNGNRVDLMEKLSAMRPKFLRFPGGNYLEGNTVATRFDWKKTIGPPLSRRGHTAPWGYWSTDGLGLLEFLEWCEDLGMEPVLGVYAGLSLHEKPVAAGEDLQPFVQDALDEIEYITGDPSTPWGARRAQDGHPAPFKLTYVEIGNEDDFGNRETDYEHRFADFFDALKAKYPALQLIATMPVTSRKPDVLDEHFYRSAEQFIDDVDHYNAYDRKGPKIFVGEWATLEGDPTPNLHAALGDAAWMIGMERNADLVIMQAYAPLLANVNPGARQWRTNLIGYDALTSYGSPSYYAQVMFNTHRGDVILDTSPGVAPNFAYSVTRDSKTGILYIKAVNGQGSARAVRIELAGLTHVDPTGRQIILASANPTDTNTLSDPEKIVPVESALPSVAPTFEHTFPAYSITVLALKAK